MSFTKESKPPKTKEGTMKDYSDHRVDKCTELSSHACQVFPPLVYTPETSGAAIRPRVFILSDVRLYRESLAWSLSHRSEIEVIGAAAASPGALMQIATSAAAAVILDVAMPSALNLPRELIRLAPSIKVIAFAVREVDHELIAYAEAGIVGYVTRDGSIDDLVKSV